MMRVRLPRGGDAFWIVPGGGLEDGESYQDALQRELAEELGLSGIEVGPLIWRRDHTFDWDGGRLRQYEQYYLVHTERFAPRMLDDREQLFVHSFQWFPIAELDRVPERLTPLSIHRILSELLADGPPVSPPPVEVLVD